MESTSRDDVRSLLKTFGIQADEAVIRHLARTPGDRPLLLRLALEDITDYGDQPPADELRLVIEGEVRR
ncbi:MAG: hypothetical protein GTO14_16945 [Anaerolineales bacterium]|nr:hypothetical protein [Anaerolineales bacterium]